MGYIRQNRQQKLPEMHPLLILATLFIPALLAAEPDCSQRPNVTSLKNCCRLPNLNLSSYNSQCGMYLLSGAHITPCSFECIFQAAKVLNGTSLILENVEKMMVTMLDSPEFVQVYVDGFGYCAGQEKIMIKSLKRRRMPVVGQCSSMAVMYGLCAHRYVYRNCPDSAWSKSAGCNEAREFSIRCEDQING